MRSRLSRKLLQGQPVCFFCAVRYGIEPRTSNALVGPSFRSYKSSASSRRPAGAAVARLEEEEDDSDNLPVLNHPVYPRPRSRPARVAWSENRDSTPEVLGWRCRCHHVNSPTRNECTLCSSPRPQSAELVSKEKRLSGPSLPSTDATFPTSELQSVSRFGQQLNRRTSPLPRARTGRRNAPGKVVMGPAQHNTDGDRFPAGRAVAGRTVWEKAPASPSHPTEADSMNGGGHHTGEYYNFKFRRQDSPDGENHARSARFSPPRVSDHKSTREGDIASAQAGKPRSTTFLGDSFRRGNESNFYQRSTAFRSWKPSEVEERPPTTGPAGPRGVGVFGPGELETAAGESSSAPGRQRRARHSTSNSDISGGINELKERVSRESTRIHTEEAALSGPQDFQPFQSPGQKYRGSKDLPERMKGRDRRRSRMFEDDFDAPVNDTWQTSTSAPNKSNRITRGMAATSRDIDYDLEMAEALLHGDGGSGKRKKSKAAKQEKPRDVVKAQIRLPEFISVQNLAQAMKIKVDDLVAKLEEEGFEGARYDHILDAGTSAMFADLYGFDPVVADSDPSEDLIARPPAPDPSVLPPRPPIVTIMGHVDHGKTTILDWLRNSSVVESEHGGITQHIGAFSVTMPGTERQITFLDTPGHAAFLDMRRRGANVTDIVVLVVAADDSVKPQTVEAIKHALEAKVQIIVAINKIDKEDANIERVKQDLARHDITVEDYGGDYQAVPVSGKTGQGMQDLEEAIITLADVSDFRADTDGPAEGWVIESTVTPAGRVATVLVRRGTLRPGDYLVAGTTWARVRSLRSDSGQLVAEAPPGTPVQVDGWRGGDPSAGLEVLQAEDEDHAKRVVELRLERAETTRTTADMAAINAARTDEAEARAKVLAWEAEQEWASLSRRRRPKDNEGWVEGAASAGPKPVHFVIKADVAGSVEALAAAVSAIGNHEVVANVIHSGTGPLTESDIRRLAATGEVGYAISFNQPVDSGIQRLAEAAKLNILDHNIIYKVTDDVKEKLSAELPPLVTQRVLGEAEIGQIFEISVKKRKLKVAGCKVTNGTISRSEKVRVLRRGEVVYTGMLDSLKNVKKDVTEMRKGSECGMGFANWDDFQAGDQIQSFAEIEEPRTLY